MSSASSPTLDTTVDRSPVRRDASADDVVRKTPTSAEPPSSPQNLPDCKVRRNYTCSGCDFFTQNPRLHLYHLRDVHRHNIKVYECPSCLYASKHFQKLLRHSKMVHGTSKGVTAAETSRKRRSAQADAEQEDPEEDQEGAAPPERHHNIKTRFFRCSKCSYVTHIKARYTKHVKYHSMPMIKCDGCDFRTPYKWNLDRHRKNHNGKGAFRCAACDFTADIKQSLTVHEMNHHVPPVGQAQGVAGGRRRNKVGASDAAALQAAPQADQVAKEEDKKVKEEEEEEEDDDEAQQQRETTHQVLPLVEEATATTTATPRRPKIKITPKKAAVAAATPPTPDCSQSGAFSPSDFIHPDDFVQHSNGKVYIKNKCKKCNFKTPWDGEMAKHERQFHGGGGEVSAVGRKTAASRRPVPNLIPIRAALPMMSQKDMNEICSRSGNSALKDLASLFDSEDVFEPPSGASTSKVPDLIPMTGSSSKKSGGAAAAAAQFNRKNASFFDRLKEKLDLNTGSDNLVCSRCGHRSSCLTEQARHRCGKEGARASGGPKGGGVVIPMRNISSSRCQYCRQRCKSSADLFLHLQTCVAALRAVNGAEEGEEEDDDDEDEEEDAGSDDLKIDLGAEEGGAAAPPSKGEGAPHPMENKVFVWNDIMVPMDIEVDDSNYEYTDERLEDNGSLDLSVRTQSPACSDSSNSVLLSASSVPHHHHHQDNNNTSTSANQNLSGGAAAAAHTSEKIPTHGNDISVAQHKRVFKCPHCTFWASTASRFHVHIVGHLNKKPFECSLCSYRSNWRWDITKHIKLKSVRDQAHETAKVLMTDETGRRNYTKYNKYLTEIPLSSLQSSNETSGGSGTRPRNHQHQQDGARTGSPSINKSGRLPPLSGNDLNSLLKLKPPLADKHFLQSVAQEKKRGAGQDGKRTLFKCKKCNFKDASRDILLQHVKGHYETQQQQQEQLQHQQHALMQATSAASPLSLSLFSTQDLSLRGTSPDRDDERHCRLKHKGDIRVVSTKNGQEKVEVEEQMEEDAADDQADAWGGVFTCSECPFSTDSPTRFQLHLPGHSPQAEAPFKCDACGYSVVDEDELQRHLRLHVEPPEGAKKFRCLLCPYTTNAKSQYTHHKQFHRDKGGQYACAHCSYNVSKRHLLHQHLKVHDAQAAKSGEAEDLAPAALSPPFADIPLVWVSKDGKFSKMFKCRFCPHVNLRKVNIQEHEKMHSSRSTASQGATDQEQRCQECSYVCNNAGVLSSHSKVHQGLYGTVHCLVDPTRTDEEQLKELVPDTIEEGEEEELLYFCTECPARFLRENEFEIHKKFHDSPSMEYKCPNCSYSVDDEGYLTSHQKVHTLEYQERTDVLRGFHMVHLVVPKSDVAAEQKHNILAQFLSKPPKVSSQMNVPLSGTELFQQRSEAQLRQGGGAPQGHRKTPDREEMGDLIQGNPAFIYQTYIKNGRVKEKRYKCHKCPSAFEKREQYKVHLGLHGSKQRYVCDSCDYSVPYYANYAQHLKKHKFNDEAQAAKTSSPQPPPALDDAAAADNNNDTSAAHGPKKAFWCPYCPYSNGRKDALDNHLRRHSVVSGSQSAYTCEYCDYSAPQAHFLREHGKLHFSAPKSTVVNGGFVACDNLKLTSLVQQDDGNNEEETVVFDEDDAVLEEEEEEGFNNNKGETVDGDSVGKTNVQMEVVN